MSDPQMLTSMRFAFLGGGNMASAMIAGLTACGVPPSQILVVAPSVASRQRLNATLDVQAQAAPDLEFGCSDVIVLAVKPQQLQAAVNDLAPYLTGGLIVSLVAGVRLDVLQRMLGSSRMVRAMPNTAASLGKSMTGLSAPATLDPADRTVATALAMSVGQCMWVDDDDQLDAVTALSGSGPAYVFYLIEAMEQAAMTLGLSHAQGRQLAVETCLGAAMLASQADEPVAVLRDRVTSKGGTTEAAIQVLDSRGVRDAFVLAVQAAVARSQALSADF